jgi:hypothetical protein
MRYQARWSNGYWKVFDRTKFADVATCVTRRLAEDAALDFNVGETKPRRFNHKRR